MARLSHRGPDGKDTLHTKYAAMGHWHFWTTPEEVDEKQPLQIKGLPFTILLDGRIDNRKELFKLLNISPKKGKNISDASLILHAYQRWSTRCVEYFVGDFALAIIDEAKKEFFCARDHLGDRTLFYTSQTSETIIASEPWAIAGAFNKAPVINEKAVAHHIAFRAPENGGSFFEGILELLPAHAMTINASGEKKWCYWKPELTKKIRYKSDEEYAQHFLSLLRESVRVRMRSTTSVGVFMSGGIDSTAIACLAAPMLAPKKLKTISFVYDELKDSDERDYIAEIEKKCAIRSIKIPSDDAWAFRDEDQEPLTLNLPSQSLFRSLNQQGYASAEKNGIRVMLSGEAGDHLFRGGIYVLVDLLSEGKIRQTLDELTYSRRIGVRSFLRQGFLQCAARWLLNKLPYGKYIRRRQKAPEWLSEFSHEYTQKKSKPDSYINRHASALDIATSRRHSQEHYYSSRHSVELRYPFRDRRLIEFVLALPAYQLYSQGLHKYILRTAMQDILPDLVRLNPKKIGLTSLLERGFEREKTLFQQYAQGENAIWHKYINVGWINRKGDFCHLSDPTPLDILIRWLCTSYALWHKYISQIKHNNDAM